MPQDGPKIVPRGLLAALGRSWTALRPLLAALGRSWLAPGASWADLGASWGDRGPSWGDLGALLEDLGAILGAQGGVKTPRVAAVVWSSGAPPRDFLQKVSAFKGLEITTMIRDVHNGPTTRRAALGAAD